MDWRRAQSRLRGNIGVGPITAPAPDIASGLTGINRVYERTAISGGTGSTQMLYRVDANEGGDSDTGGTTPLDGTTLERIDFSSRASDWFRLGMKFDTAGNGVA